MEVKKNIGNLSEIKTGLLRCYIDIINLRIQNVESLIKSEVIDANDFDSIQEYLLKTDIFPCIQYTIAIFLKKGGIVPNEGMVLSLSLIMFKSIIKLFSLKEHFKIVYNLNYNFEGIESIAINYDKRISNQLICRGQNLEFKLNLRYDEICDSICCNETFLVSNNSIHGLQYKDGFNEYGWYNLNCEFTGDGLLDDMEITSDSFNNSSTHETLKIRKMLSYYFFNHKRRVFVSGISKNKYYDSASSNNDQFKSSKEDYEVKNISSMIVPIDVFTEDLFSRLDIDTIIYNFAPALYQRALLLLNKNRQKEMNKIYSYGSKK